MNAQKIAALIKHWGTKMIPLTLTKIPTPNNPSRDYCWAHTSSSSTITNNTTNGLEIEGVLSCGASNYDLEPTHWLSDVTDELAELMKQNGMGRAVLNLDLVLSDPTNCVQYPYATKATPVEPPVTSVETPSTSPDLP